MIRQPMAWVRRHRLVQLGSSYSAWLMEGAGILCVIGGLRLSDADNHSYYTRQWAAEGLREIQQVAGNNNNHHAAHVLFGAWAHTASPGRKPRVPAGTFARAYLAAARLTREARESGDECSSKR